MLPRVIDLHCHILPGLDDGPATIDESLALAHAMSARDITTAVATPHIRGDYPFDPAEIPLRARELERVLAEKGISLAIVEGAEVAISKVPELDEALLRTLCIGGGPYMLVESPYSQVSGLLEESLFDLQLRGFRPVLAHPERCPSFQQDPARLARLVHGGVFTSVTAASMIGRFGGIVRRFTATLFAERLVHNVATDAHDPVGRSLNLREAFNALDGRLPGLDEQAPWFTAQVPEAIIAGRDLPMPPEAPRRRGKGLRRLIGG